VGYETDELIGKTIREKSSGSTILTSVHRLRTDVDYHRAMALGQGRLLGFDSPAKLLANSNSKFFALCKATGEEFAQPKMVARSTTARSSVSHKSGANLYL
jgi:ABC-type multidrug transport system fused ATPase/permease subunit